MTSVTTKTFTLLDDATYFMESNLRGLDPQEIIEAKLVFVNSRWQVGIILKEVG